MTSHRYLMDEHPHFFYPTLAEKLGLNEAIVIQQIHSWIQTYLKDPDRYREKHYHDGAWWTWNSYPEWHKKLPYLSENTIKRAILYLRQKGILKTGNYNTLKIDRTLWYTINYEIYDKLWTDQETKSASPSAQNGTMEETNLSRPLPDSSPPVFSSALEEPPAADSPPADDLGILTDIQMPPAPPIRTVIVTCVEKSDDPSGQTDEIAETEASFKTPAPRERHDVQQRHDPDDPIGGMLAAARRTETARAQVEHPDFSDPTHDSDSWGDALREFCRCFQPGLDPDALPPVKCKNSRGEIKRLAEEVLGRSATPARAIQVMEPFAALEGWLVKPTTTPFKSSWAEGFQTMLMMAPQAVQVLLGAQRNGGSSGPRGNDGGQVKSDPETEAAYNRVFDEHGNRRPEYR